MKKKFLAIVLAAVLVLTLGLTLVGPVVAASTDLWQIGICNDASTEFNDTGWLGVSSAVYDFATDDDDDDFPRLLYTAGHPDDIRGVHDVTINFTLDASYSVTLEYRRAGVEKDEISVDGGVTVEITGVAENVFATHTIPLGVLGAGSHSILILCIDANGGDGHHSSDCLKLTGERICNSTCASSVVDSSQGKTFGGGSINPSRTDPDNATGAPDRMMFSLGFSPPDERYIELDFGQLVGTCLTVYENSPPLYQLADDPDYVNQETWDNDEPNSIGYPEERAEVWGSVSGEEGDWTLIGIATNKTLEIGSEGDDLHIHPNYFELNDCIQYVRIVEISDEDNFVLGGHDGFDLDAVCAGACFD